MCVGGFNLKRNKKFIKKYITSRFDIPGYKEETIEEALRKANYVLKNVSNLSSTEFNDLLPKQFRMIFGTGRWEVGSILLRSRLIGVSIANLKDAGHWKESEFWEAPAKLVKTYGRLNEPGESVFYLSNNPLQTFKEIRYQVDDNKNQAVILNSYKVKKGFTANIIGKKFNNVTDVSQVYSNMINTLFSYPSEIYGENVYKLSNFLSNFYRFLPEGPRVFAYPPVGETDERLINLAFEPEDAHEYLEYNGSVIIPDYNNSVDSNITVSVASDKYFNFINPSDNLPWIRDNFYIDFT